MAGSGITWSENLNVTWDGISGLHWYVDMPVEGCLNYAHSDTKRSTVVRTRAAEVKKASWALACVYLFCWGSWGLDFNNHDGLLFPGLWAKINLFSLKLFLSRVFYHSKAWGGDNKGSELSSTNKQTRTKQWFCTTSKIMLLLGLHYAEITIFTLRLG